ncbi:hypothetical protein LCGC14_0471180 [marine sediment metagenome]|uniref:Tetratricopeptide repeat protein n=1 Tax=marine sediment metagenome TaxID=412755 RepID=A0A0F9UZ09_9ZZZZ|nr:hypothetical protein [Phycisphaerae bacterium]HDZ42497.1 hypothetical protein [Phycisphaerae bacterium]
MRRFSWRLCVAALAVGLLLPTGVGWTQDDDGESTYQGLPPDALIEQLIQFGMTELLDHYIAGSGGGPDALIAQATAPGISSDKRNSLLEQAINALTGQIDAIEPGGDPMEKLERFQLTFKKAWTIVSLRCGPSNQRLRYLRGGDADREEVVKWTEAPVRTLRRLDQDIQDAIRKLLGAGGPHASKYLILVMPELEDLQLKVNYRAAWSNFYRAAAINPATNEEMTAKRRLLTDAIDRVGDFAGGEDTHGVKFASILLTGMCLREAGNYDEAIAKFRIVRDADTELGLRFSALFEMPRTLTEQGKFSEAQTALAQFSAAALQLVGKDYAWEVRLNSAMLGHYLYQRWALADPSRQGQLQTQAEQALVTLVQQEANPSYQQEYYKIIAKKYRGGADEELSSVVLLAKAKLKRVEAFQTEQPKQREELLDETKKLLGMILERTDPLSQSLRDQVLEEKGIINAVIGESQEAALDFLQLAQDILKDDPNNPRAAQMAENAVRLAYQVLYERQEAGEHISHRSREVFIQAAAFLLSQPAWREAKPELAEWYMDLGWQYAQLAGGENDADQKIAMCTKAIEAYESVPAEIGGRSNTREHMEARYLGLRKRAEILEIMTLAKVSDAQALAVRAKLKAYGNDATNAARNAERAGDDALRADLFEWGSDAEFRAAELLYEPLGQAGLAVDELVGLRNRWPGTTILENSFELEIRVLVKERRVAEAVTKVKNFYDKYPDKGAELIRLVTVQVRKGINKARYDPTAAGSLKNLQEGYYELASMLAEGIDFKQQQALAENYRLAQMVAEARYEVDKPDLALELFQACTALRDIDRQGQIKVIEAAYEKHVGKLNEIAQAKQINTTELMSLAEQFMERLKQAGYGPDHPASVAVRDARDNLQKVQADAKSDASKRKAAAAILLRVLRGGYRREKRRQLVAVPLDPVNIQGVARCQVALGKYEEGLLTYDNLIRRTDPEAFGDLYWLAQLERGRAALAAYADDADGLRGVIRLIIQLDYETNGQFGGKASLFAAIESKAKEHLIKLNEPWGSDLPTTRPGSPKSGQAGSSD